MSVLVLRPITDYIRLRGGSVEEFLQRIGVSEDALVDDLGRVPVYKLVQMTTAAARAARDEDLGLHLAERSAFDTYGTIGLMAVQSSTLGEAFGRVKRATRFLMGFEGYEIRTTGAVTSLCATRPPFAPVDRQATEWLLGVPHVYSRSVSVRPWRPTEVTFTYPRPKSVAEHARIFDCPVRFSASVDAIHFPSDLLDSPSRLSNGEVARTLERAFSDRGESGFHETDLAARVRVLVWHHLRHGDTTIEQIARDLKMSPRTLQRGLLAANTSHRQILDEVRAVAARHLLENESLKLVEIAIFLGFSDQSAFQRAFVRWMGVSPAKWKRRSQSSPQS